MRFRLLFFTITFILGVCCFVPFSPNVFAEESAPKKKDKKAAISEDRSIIAVDKNRDNNKRMALVVGNSNYGTKPLKNPANDARAIAASLRHLGFEVEEKINANFVEMNQAVEKFGKKLRAGGIGLFYYAGHGMQVDGVNYLIPVDAKIEDENEVRYKAVDAGLVMAKMEQARSEVNIIVLDACRDNPFTSFSRSSRGGLASMNAPNGTFIAYATAPGKTAADGDEKNGLYASELVKVLNTPGIPLEQIFKKTLKAVREMSDGRQVPWIASNLEGEFYFIFPASMTELKLSTDQPQPLVPTAPIIRTSRVEPTIEMEMISVPGGCFKMGDTLGDGYPNEKPAHEVCLSDFSIGKYVVTQLQWKKVIGNNPSYFNRCGDDCPVENVSWNDIHQFIKKLNEISGLRYRLPTEAEWEYAARSGGKDVTLSGGGNREAMGWYYGNSDKKTHPVGQKQPNELGIYDMTSNVWEWVGDWYDDNFYVKSPYNDPVGPPTGTDRVFRGANYLYDAELVHTTHRHRNVPEFRLSGLGFRLVLSGAP